jgi:3-methyl-2-oxobutanoate hydroxymethyltransferase
LLPSGSPRVPGKLFDQADDRLLKLWVGKLRIGFQQPHCSRGDQKLHDPGLLIVRSLSVSVRKEMRHGHIQYFRDAMQAAGSDPVGALLVLLHLLERQAQARSKVGLRHMAGKPPRPDAPAHFNVEYVATFFQRFPGIEEQTVCQQFDASQHEMGRGHAVRGEPCFPNLGWFFPFLEIACGTDPGRLERGSAKERHAELFGRTLSQRCNAKHIAEENAIHNGKSLPMSHAASRISVQQLQRMKNAWERIVALEVHDSVMAGIADAAGVDVLVTDPSGPMALFGHGRPADVTFEEQLMTTRAVTRVARRALVAARMPFMCFQLSPRDALLGAKRLVSEGGVDAVICDANGYFLSHVEAVAACGIPVIAHIDFTDRAFVAQKGERASEAERRIEDARALVEAGAVAILAQAAAPDIVGLLSQRLPIPILSTTANGDGVYALSSDLVNYRAGVAPAGATPVLADLRTEIQTGLRQYMLGVREGRYPDERDAPRMSPEESAAFTGLMAERKRRTKAQ